MGKWPRARAEMQVRQWSALSRISPSRWMPNTAGPCGDADFMALVKHELYHAAQETDAFGAPKFSRSAGRPVFTFSGHDVEEFCAAVRRYGADAAGVRAIVDAAHRPPEIARAQIAHACGTCQLIA